MTIPRGLLAACVSAATVSIGIIFPPAWWSVFFGFALFVWALSAHSTTSWQAFVIGALFGTITAGAGTVWFWDTLPLDFLGIHNSLSQFSAMVIIWLYVSLSLGLVVGLGGLLLRRCTGLALSPVLVAIVWALTERGRMWAFSLATWAPQSLLGAHFSAAAIGYPLVENSVLRQLADPYGLDALNFCVPLISTSLVGVASLGRPRQRIMHLAQGMIPLAVLAASVSSASGPVEGDRHASLRFAVVASNHPEVFDTTSHTRLREQIAEAAAARPPVDVVVLPEEFGLTSLFWSEGEAQAFFRKHFGDRDVLILNTRNELFPDKEMNLNPEFKKLLYDSTKRGEVGRYIKRNLMPLGEYSPVLTSTVFSVISDPELHQYIDDVKAGAGPSPDLPMSSITFQGVRVGGLLCSDLLSPSLYRSLVEQEHPDVLVNLANQFWFHGSRALYWKTLQFARVHAVQNRKPLILANNMAPSFVVNSAGEVVSESAWGAAEVLYVSLP